MAAATATGPGSTRQTRQAAILIVEPYARRADAAETLTENRLGDLPEAFQDDGGAGSPPAVLLRV